MPENVIKDFTYNKPYNNLGGKYYYYYHFCLTNDVTACIEKLRNLPYMVCKHT